MRAEVKGDEKQLIDLEWPYQYLPLSTYIINGSVDGFIHSRVETTSKGHAVVCLWRRDSNERIL